MKNITITLDLKSLCVGALGVLCVVSLSNFNKADGHRNDAADEVHRYQAVSGEQGVIILDTKTGRYLFDAPRSLRTRWQKGDFTTTHDEK